MSVVERLYRRIAARLTREFKLHVLRDPFTREHARWLRDNGETQLRFNYPLSKESVVFDVGGYKGEYSAQIIEKFNSQVFIFEPERDAFQKLTKRFSGQENVRVFDFALSGVDGSFTLFGDDDGASLLRRKSSQGKVQHCRSRAIDQVIREIGVKKIDLIKINIEGGEYDLLEAIISTGIIENITFLQVQFHDFIPDALVLRADLTNRMQATHKRQWCYDFVWESWTLKLNAD